MNKKILFAYISEENKAFVSRFKNQSTFVDSLLTTVRTITLLTEYKELNNALQNTKTSSKERNQNNEKTITKGFKESPDQVVMNSAVKTLVSSCAQSSIELELM